MKLQVHDGARKALEQQLRDTHTNNTHRRVLTNGNKDKPLIIFETNDMVFVYNPDGFL